MPTQTFNPTATWHNTSQYQENGDVTDAAVGAAATGEDAMDNIAYLTGARTNTQVRQLGTVADLAALKAVAAGDRRDQDYLILDSNKRVYQFDSASAATGDDYSVVTPNAGTGRWILAASAVPQTTAMRWVKMAAAMVPDIFVVAGEYNNAMASGYVSFGSGATGDNWLYAEFDEFAPGDVISEIELVGNLTTDGTAQVEATFYSNAAADAGTSPTVTSLGTLVDPGPSTGNFTTSSTAAPLPITIPAAPSKTKVTVKVLLKNTGGVANAARLYWVALNGTRSYITE